MRHRIIVLLRAYHRLSLYSCAVYICKSPTHVSRVYIHERTAPALSHRLSCAAPQEPKSDDGAPVSSETPCPRGRFITAKQPNASLLCHATSAL